MAFLVTGGASQVGTAVARLLRDAGKKVIIGSRSGRVPDGYEVAKLDWADRSTIDTPFVSGEPIQGVYIMAPPGASDTTETIIAFIDKAVAHGVERFVLLAGSAVHKDSDFGKVWKYLDDKKLDYFVLRPTAFMDNFHQFDGTSIRERNEFTTVMPNAKVPFVSAVDIGELAFRALMSEKNEHSDQYVIGPELLTYDQVAEVLSKILGRTITHNVITGEQMTQLYTEVLGLPLQPATFLVAAQLDMDAGSAERLWGNPEAFVGKETFREWAERHKTKLSPTSSKV